MNKDFIMWFDSQTGEPLTYLQQESFVNKLRDLAIEYDMDIHMWGTPESVHRFFQSLEQAGYFEEETEEEDD